MTDKNLNDEGAKNRAKGAAKELEGKVRAKVGDAVDNRDQHAKGLAQQVKGKVQQGVGKVQQSLSSEPKKDET